MHGRGVADAVRVLYGGSVKSGNVAAIMAEADVDGALVGGASLDPDEFAAICRYRSTRWAWRPARRPCGRPASVPWTVDAGSRDPEPAPTGPRDVTALRITLQVLLGITSLFLTLLILLHKGKGGGLSDMFGGGMSVRRWAAPASRSATSTGSPSRSACSGRVIVLLGVLERFVD